MKRLDKSKLTKENFYKFFIDRTNKSLVIMFLSFLLLFFCVFIIPNFIVKIIVYYIGYVLLVKKYDKIVNFLFLPRNKKELF